MSAAPGPTREPRVRAPRLTGRRWLGVEGDLSLADLRGRVVLLHLWTSCCVNCVHVLDELRPLEAEFPDALVVLGVHSPKFPHEAVPAALDAAVERLGVEHPVLDDSDLTTWRAYAARAWPTLVVVDPEGYVVRTVSGEGHGPALRTLVAELVAEHGARGTLRPDAGPVAWAGRSRTALRFPSRVLALPCGGLLVADTAHHQLVALADDLVTERWRTGCGAAGLVDGDARSARFRAPQGFALLPRGVAERTGVDVVVADTGNHALRGLRLADGSVTTLAGTGRPLRRREGGGPALQQDLSSPLDVAWFDGQVVVAMSGLHQLWAFDPAADPRDGVVRVLAGTTAEGLLDGPAEAAWCAQPSGLAVARTAEEEALWFVDAETSALRSLRRSGSDVDRSVPVVRDTRLANVEPVAGAGYVVRTAAGAGLFEFGHVDGPAGQALLQHPLGLAVAPDGAVLVADAFNGAVRRLDPVTGEVTTLLRGLAEPCDVLVDDGALLVVESAAHRVVREDVPAAAEDVPVRWPGSDLAPGAVHLVVEFTPPPGQVLDDRWGEPTLLSVSATPPDLLRAGEGDVGGLEREVVLVAGATGVLHVEARAASCDEAPDGAAQVRVGAACHLHRRVWDVPVRVVVGAAQRLVLPLPSPVDTPRAPS